MLTGRSAHDGLAATERSIAIAIHKETHTKVEDLEQKYPPRSLTPEAEVVRVAPSPTGKPHIGTAMQSLIDYALARKTGGVFILRIEDTDRKRLDPEALVEIIESLHWLEIPPDEGPEFGGDYGPYLESERLEIYRAVTDRLVEGGHAYLCFCSPERLAALREEQAASGQPPRYDRHCRELTADERRAHAEAGEHAVVRLAMPVEGTIVFEDLVRGRIEFESAQQDDPVLLKSDGYPTYHLAAIVDDHFMRVTTVVRGEEWISSTPKHIVLHQALGWSVPRIVHTPLLRDAQGRKLSKRWGDTSIAWFRSQGYLPEAFRNFLTRIIWVHPDGRDIYPYGEFVDRMDPVSLPKTGPMADLGLLDFICAEYIRMLDAATLYRRTAQWLDWLLGLNADPLVFQIAEKQGRTERRISRDELTAFWRSFIADPAYSQQVLSLEPERYRKLGDIVLQTPLYYRELFKPPDSELLVKQTRGDRSLAVSLLMDCVAHPELDAGEPEWQTRIRALAERMEVKAGVPFMLLRVAITGAERTPPLYPIMQLLGPSEVRRRLDLALTALGLPPGS